MQQSNRNDWNVRFEVTFYGNDPNKGSFREIQEDNVVFAMNSKLKINYHLIMLQMLRLIFLIWVDTLPIGAHKITS